MGMLLVLIRMSQTCVRPSTLVQSGVISVMHWITSIVPRTVCILIRRRPYSSNCPTGKNGPTLLMVGPTWITRWRRRYFSKISSELSWPKFSI